MENKKFIEKVKEKAMHILNEIIKSNEENRKTLEEFVKQSSENIDKFILSYEEENEADYVSGSFSLICLPSNRFRVDVDLYFKDKLGQWLKQSTQSNLLDMESYLTNDAYEELKNSDEQKMTFSVNKPSR